MYKFNKISDDIDFKINKNLNIESKNWNKVNSLGMFNKQLYLHKLYVFILYFCKINCSSSVNSVIPLFINCCNNFKVINSSSLSIPCINS